MKKVTALIMCLIVLCSPLLGLKAFAAGKDLQSATELVIGKNCTGYLSSTNKFDFYKCELKSSGKVHFKFIAYAESTVYVYFFDSNGNKVDYFGIYPNGNLGYCLCEKDAYFNKGEFFVKIDSLGSGIRMGEYTISTSFTSANETFPETLNDNDNYIGSANSIGFNKTYKGQLAYSDKLDFYDLDVKSPCSVVLSAKAITATVPIYISILDSSYNEISWVGINKNENLGYSTLKKNLTLNTGHYYFKFVISSSSDFGFYEFSINKSDNTSTEKNTTTKVTTTKVTTTKVSPPDIDKKPTSNSGNDYTEKTPVKTNVAVDNGLITTVSNYIDNSDDYIDDSVDYIDDSADGNETFTYQNFICQIINSEIIIVNYIGSDLYVCIPSTINGMNVVEIADGAFVDTNVEEVEIPKTVIRIGQNAFENELVTITGDLDSYAREYAEEYGLGFVSNMMEVSGENEGNNRFNFIILRRSIPYVIIAVLLIAIVCLLVKKKKSVSE